jgi:hypothetical protein
MSLSNTYPIDHEPSNGNLVRSMRPKRACLCEPQISPSFLASVAPVAAQKSRCEKEQQVLAVK